MRMNLLTDLPGKYPGYTTQGFAGKHKAGFYLGYEPSYPGYFYSNTNRHPYFTYPTSTQTSMDTFERSSGVRFNPAW